MRRRRWLAGCALTASSALLELRASTVLAAATPGPSPEGEPATYFLPLFPLAVVAFPGELVFLHVFEPRYKQLIKECAEDGIGFGIVTIVPGGASSIGTEMRLDRILRTDASGSSDVAVRGVRAFELMSFERVVEDKLYSAGRVAFKRNDASVDSDVQDALVEAFNRTLQRAGSRELIAPPFPENLSFAIGHEVGLTRAEELQLLTMPAERDRQAYLLSHLLRRQ